MLQGNINFIIDALMWAIVSTFIILMLLEIVTAEKPPKPMRDKRDWQEKEKDD